MSAQDLKREPLLITDCWNTIGIWGSQLPRCEKLEQHIHCRNCKLYSDAGRKVLERNLTENYESNWASVYSQEKKLHVKNKESLTIFRLGDEIMALPTEVITSINNIGNVHSIPHHKSKILRGITNLHGELKICVSLGQLLGLHKAVNEIDKLHRVYNRMVEINKDSQNYIFIVCEVLGIHHIIQEDLKEVPATISQSHGTFTKALIQWNEKDIAYLDAELIFYNLGKNLL